MTAAHPLDRLSTAAGIERVYYDQWGARHEVRPETIYALAETLGVTERAGASASAGLAMLEPATILRADDARPKVNVLVPAGDHEAAFEWMLLEESGTRSSGTFRAAETEFVGGTADRRHERRQFTLPRRLEAGYHRLRIRGCIAPIEAETLLIVAPRRAYMPAELEQGPGLWGFAAQLYSLRSARDWGIGDFGSLGSFIRFAAEAGAGAVGVNPLHALALDEPERASPYSPNSRKYLNPLYIEIEAVPDFAECAEARALVASSDFVDALQRLRAAPLVDYRGVAFRKLRALGLLHESFRKRHLAAATPRARAFAAFVGCEGEAMRHFCTFQALREARSAADPGQHDWRNWPAEYADPRSATVAAFADAHASRIEFFAYCQWIARSQLAACAAAARAAGMRVGLYGDLAAGVDAAAGEAWAAQDVIVGGWSIGAPPDAWNQCGQDWGLSPLSPAALRRLAYRPFVELIRANMRDVGALRIDHVLGLWRSFWIRHGHRPSEGAYVRYPFADLIAILALESHRARCIVIGEDLGTVPEGLREALQSAGILSYRLIYFERRSDGRRCRSGDYPHQALVAVGTHDLPPLVAFWRGTDIELRRVLGQFHSDHDAEEERRRRAAEREEFTALWRSEGLAADRASDDAPVEAAYRFLARTPGRIVMVQLEDALGLAEQVNVPGTVDEHPNWRRRLPLPVETLFEDERVRSLCAVLNCERRPSVRLGARP